MNTEDNSGEDENKKMFDKINKRLAALEQLNGMLLKKNNTLEGKIKELKGSIGNNLTSSDNKDNNNEWKEKLIEEINTIKEENKKYNTIIEEINTKISSNQSSDDLKGKIEEISQRMNEDKTSIDKMKSELESKIEKEVENVKGEIDGSKLLQDESIKTIENKVKELEGVLVSKENEIKWKNKVEGQLKELLSFKEDNSIDDIKAKINEIASFNKEMKQNIEDINKKYQVCNSEFNTKHESLSKEINDTKSLIEEKNKTMSEFVSSMIDKMKNELNNAQENKYQPIEKTITEHKQLIDTISKDNSNFNETIKQYSSWKETVDEQIKEEASKYDKMSTELTSKVSNIEKEIDSISILSKQVEAINVSIQELSQLTSKIDTMNTSIESNKEIVNNQIKAIEEKITENITTMQNTIESTNGKLNDMGKWKDEIDKLTAIKEDVHKHKQLLLELEPTIDTLKEDQGKHSRLLSELENKITSIESSNDSSRMKSKLEQLQGIIDTTSISIDNIDKKIISIESINAKHTNDITKNSDTLDKIINVTLSSIKNDILSIIDSKIETIDTKNSIIEEKVVSIENTFKDLKTISEELNKINDTIGTLSKWKSNIEETIPSIKEEISTKNNELMSLINDKENTHNISVKKINEKIEALTEIKTNIDTIDKKIKELNDSSEVNIKEQYNIKIELSQKLKELFDKVNTTENAHIETIKEIKDELIGTKSSIQSIEKEISSITNSNDINNKNLTESIENNKKEQESNIISIKNELLKQINDLISKVDSKDTSHNESIKIITNELRGANASIQSLESKLSSISINTLKDLPQLKDSIDTQIISFKEITKDVSSIKEKMHDTQSQQNYINNIDKLNSELTIIKDTNAKQVLDINKAIDTLKGELLSLKRDLEEKITIDIKEVIGKYDTLTTSINDIEKTISSHSTSMNNIFTSLNQIEVLSDIVKTNDSKTSLVINEINTKLTELQNNLRTSISSLESNTKELTSSLSSHITKENQRTSNLELSIKTLHSRPSESSSITNDDLNSLKSSIQSQIDNLAQLLKAKSSSDISKELLDINNQLTYMRSNNIKSLSDINTSIDQLFQKTKHIAEDTEKYQSELQTMKSDLDANIKAIWDSISLACESNFFNNSVNSLHTPKDN